MVRMVAELSSYYKVLLRITLDGEDIKGSPFTVTVIPSGLFNVGFWNSTFRMVDERAVSKCHLAGLGIEGAVAGERAEFNIVTKQSEGEVSRRDSHSSFFSLLWILLSSVPHGFGVWYLEWDQWSPSLRRPSLDSRFIAPGGGARI